MTYPCLSLVLSAPLSLSLSLPPTPAIQWTLYPNGKPKTVAISQRGIHIQDGGHVCLFSEAFPVTVADDDDDDDDSEYYSTSTTSSIGSLEQPHDGSNRYKRRDDDDDDAVEKEPVIDEDKTMEETEEDEARGMKGKRNNPQQPTKRRRRRRRTGTTAPTTPHNNTNMLQRGEVMLQYLPIAVCQFDINGKLHYQNPEASHIFGWPTKKTTTATSNDDHACDGGGGGGDDGIGKEAVRKPTDVEIDRNVEKKLTIPEKVIPQDKKDFETETRSEDGGRSYDNDFVNRFVDRTEGIRIFERIISGNDVNVEALVHTKLGPGWNAIHARLGKPMESGGSGGRKKSKSSKKNTNNRSSNNNEEEEEEEPCDRRMILFSARDISEIITAKREMQLSLERAEFFAIMVSIY